MNKVQKATRTFGIVMIVLYLIMAGVIWALPERNGITFNFKLILSVALVAYSGMRLWRLLRQKPNEEE